MKIRKHLIILPKERLISIDTAIPIVMELKAEHPDYKVILVLPSRSHFELVNKNIHLMECLSLMDAEIISPPVGGRLSRLFYILSLFRRFAFARNIFFKAGDIIYQHKTFMKILKRISSVTEIKLLIITSVKYFCKERVAAWKTIVDKDPDKVLGQALDRDDDFLITSICQQDINRYYEDGVPDEKYIYAGYVRRFSEWQKFFRNKTEEYPIINRQRYCLFILTTMGKRLNQIEEPPIKDTLRKSLMHLKQFNSKLHTVFKPHPLTDMEIFNEIIEEVGYENYSVDYGHPSVLSSKAEFVMGNAFSNTMYDSYFLKRPVVLYSQYHRTWKEKFEKWPYVDFLCDRDPERFVKTVEGILDGKITVSRDQKFIDENFPAPPESFYHFFKTLLTE